MAQPHTDPAATHSDSDQNQESLSDYVKRIETSENLKKLAKKLEKDLKNPESSANNESAPSTPVPDLSFDKFEEKLRRSEGQ